KSEQAIATLKEATAWQTGNADVWAHLADLQLARGDWPGAEESAKKAEAASPDHVLAHWVQARLLEARGQREAASDAWKWFVDHYNAHRAELVKNADALLIIGQASERYYRSN